ncbi:MAG: hypothetical protein DRH30_00840 [Deltaproteobacteria bacterium]|nr:MAG: hypothetical protein DRH30_00840 [Deltaproteobacteria bacterium]
MKITNVRTTDVPRYGVTADGYSKRSGAPTRMLVQLEGSGIWRRVMCWQFSNAGTLFIHMLGEDHILTPENEIELAPFAS